MPYVPTLAFQNLPPQCSMVYNPALPHHDTQRLESMRHCIKGLRFELGKDNLWDQRIIWFNLAAHRCCFPPMFMRTAFHHFQYGHINPATFSKPLESTGLL